MYNNDNGDHWVVIDNTILHLQHGVSAKILPLIDHILDGRPKVVRYDDEPDLRDHWEQDCKQYEQWERDNAMYEQWLAQQQTG